MILNEKNKNILFEIILPVISFLMPFVLLLILLSANGFTLNSCSGKTMMMIDMQSEYIGYLRYFRNCLLEGKSLIYTSTKAFGGDFLSIYSFYLASPFNFLCVLFKEESLPLFFLWQCIIKISLTSLSFYLMTRFIFNKKKLGYLAFSLGYGFISYSFLYMSNYMWLDGVMILPLMVLGIEFLKQNKKLWLYPLTIGYAMLTSWYIGAMICFFSVLFFLYRFFADEGKIKSRIPFLIRYIIASLLGGLASSLVWLSAYFHLSGTKATAIFGASEWYSLSMFITGLLENSYMQMDSITQTSGYMSMFVSIPALVFFLIYFFNPSYKLKTRIGALILFALYILISLWSPLYTLYHGGREPTWFPARFSFIIGFLVVYFAVFAYDRIENSNIITTGISVLISAVLLVIATAFSNSLKLKKYSLYIISFPSLIIYLVTIALLTIYLIFKKKEKVVKYFNLTLPILLVVLTACSSYRGANNIFKVNLSSNQYQDYETYLKDDSYQSDVDKIKSVAGDEFYRMEMTFNRPGNYNDVNNNPIFYSYNGLSHFSSSERKEVESYMSKIGFHYNGFFEKYEYGSTLAMNSLFGIKYLISSSSSSYEPTFINSYPFKELTSIKSDKADIHYYENELALPLGFAMDKMGSSFVNEGEKRNGTDIYWFDHFEYQNQMFRAICPNIDKDIFVKIPTTVVDVDENLGVEQKEYGFRYLTSTSFGQYITFSFDVPSECYSNDYNLYFSEKNNGDGFQTYLNNRLTNGNDYWHKGIMSFKDNTSHHHTLKFSSFARFQNRLLREEVYYENTGVLKEYIDEIEKQSFKNVQSFSKFGQSGYVGEFELTKENQQFIFTLPYENDVDIYVDNKKVDCYQTFNIFAGVDLSNYELGSHTIKFVYTDRPFKAGIFISVFSLTSIILLSCFHNKIEGKFKKKKED